MPYAIPANIKYEERLLGPLTIKQSIYLAIGLVGAYLVMESTIPAPLNTIIALALALLGMGFAFMNLETLLSNYIGFMQSTQKSSWISPAARKLMHIKSIRTDAVYMHDGRVLGVLKVRPINFGVLSEQDKDTVIFGFLEFLNSLNFPIQIVMRSVNLDLEDYLRNLKRRITHRDDKIALAYYEHFAEYMKNYIKVNRINDRHFYIIISTPRKKTDKETITYITTQCEEISARLSLSGIVAERLNDRQLINFYKSYFTDSFELYDSYLSPITMYRKMWRETPKSLSDYREKIEKKAKKEGVA
jgi:hypothetical protein